MTDKDETNTNENSTAPASQVERLVELFAGAAPGLRGRYNNLSCNDCVYLFTDSEVSYCEKNQSMYHDWDMSPTEDFSDYLICDDFSKD